jgi:hypothetical protein
MRQSTLFPARRARAKARVMADVIDASWHLLRARCKHCGLDEWLYNPDDRRRRKVPCPECNGEMQWRGR